MSVTPADFAEKENAEWVAEARNRLAEAHTEEQRERSKAASLRRQLEQARGEKRVTVTIDGYDVVFQRAPGERQKEMLVRLASIEGGDFEADDLTAALDSMWETLAEFSVDDDLDYEFWSGYDLVETKEHIGDWMRAGVDQGN